MHAAYNGYPEIMLSLLERGANPNLQDIHGYTALMRGTSNEDMRITTTLLEWGADSTLRDKEGNGAVEWADYFNHPHISELLKADIEKRKQEAAQK